MKSRLMMIGSALIASLICLPAMAQPGPGMGGGPVYLVLKDGRVLAEVVTESTRGRELALR